jgi:hypothetical protein
MAIELTGKTYKQYRAECISAGIAPLSLSTFYMLTRDL